jgi:hypothetical protein
MQLSTIYYLNDYEIPQPNGFDKLVLSRSRSVVYGGYLSDGFGIVENDKSTSVVFTDEETAQYIKGYIKLVGFGGEPLRFKIVENGVLKFEGDLDFSEYAESDCCEVSATVSPRGYMNGFLSKHQTVFDVSATTIKGYFEAIFAKMGIVDLVIEVSDLLNIATTTPTASVSFEWLFVNLSKLLNLRATVFGGRLYVGFAENLVNNNVIEHIEVGTITKKANKDYFTNVVTFGYKSGEVLQFGKDRGNKKLEFESELLTKFADLKFNLQALWLRRGFDGFALTSGVSTGVLLSVPKFIQRFEPFIYRLSFGENIGMFELIADMVRVEYCGEMVDVWVDNIEYRQSKQQDCSGTITINSGK